MAIARAAARLLIDETKSLRYRGRLLQLGPQRLYLTSAELASYGAEAGITRTPSGLSSDAMIDDRTFFNALGFDEIESCDLHDPAADHRLDLNQPIPDELVGHYDAVFDGGTMEHVFDVQQVLRNIHDLLAPDGLAIHLAPTNNYVDHGFLMFSPGFFTAHYGANGWAVESAWMLQHTRRWQRGRWRAARYEPGSLDARSMGGFEQGSLLTFVAARKVPGATIGASPQQGVFVSGAASGRAPFARRARAALTARIDAIFPSDVVRVRPRRVLPHARRL